MATNKQTLEAKLQTFIAKFKLNHTDHVFSKLTQDSNELVDWHNIGGLAKQRTQESFLGLWTHYSWRELFIRGGIIGTTCLLAYLGAMHGSEEQHLALTVGKSLAGGVIGFVSSHYVAVQPTINRRNQIRVQTAELQAGIEEIGLRQLEQHYPLGTTSLRLQLCNDLLELTNLIIDSKLPTEQRGDNIRNLALRKSVMRSIKETLLDQIDAEKPLEEMAQYWQAQLAEVKAVVEAKLETIPENYTIAQAKAL